MRAQSPARERRRARPSASSPALGGPPPTASRPPRTPAGEAELLGAPAAELIGGRFLRGARRYSLCEDDACEALARALEIAVRYDERIRPETAAGWFATVVRHEALRVRRSRLRELSLDATNHEPPAGDGEPARAPDPRLPALRAALRQLTPDQRRALLLYCALERDRGDGGRYRRIAAATGWSYTKVNRCLREGRAALRALLLEASSTA